MESVIKDLLLSSKRVLHSSNLDISQLVKYLKARKIITVKIYQSTLSMKKDEMIDLVFETLIRKERKGWVAIRDWMIRNAPQLYQEVSGEDFPSCKKNLDADFFLAGDSLPVGNNQSPPAETTKLKPKIRQEDMHPGGGEIDMMNLFEDAMTDPWGDCSDEKLAQYMNDMENCQTPTSELLDAKNIENDMYMYELWEEILKDNLSMGDVSNNMMRCKLNLGKNIFVTAGMWRGVMKIHLRRYDPSNSFATEKGVVFDLDLWKKLVKMVDVIDVNFEQIQKMNGTDVNLEVGNNVFVGMEIGCPKIDLRLWWQPPCSKSLKRTTKGVKLGSWQWDKLKAVFHYLPTFVPELKE